MRYLISVLCLTLLAAPAWAATYFVATTGSDSNTTTQAQNAGTPWLTMQKCLNSVVAGDTCTFASGTYSVAGNTLGNTVTNGTAALPITLKSTVRYGAILQTPSQFSSGVINDITLIIDNSYYIIDGFDFSGAGGNGPDTGNDAFAVYSPSTGVIIRNNKIHGMNRTVCTASGSGSSGLYINNPSGLIVENNLIYSIGRLLQGESGCGIDSHNHDHGLYVNGSSGLIVRGNVFWDTCRGWPIHVFGSGGSSTNLTIFNNTMADLCNVAFNAGHILLAYTITTANIRNNLCYQPNVNCVAYSTAPNFTNVVIDHNMTTTGSFGSAQAGITFTNNTTSTTASSLFTNPATRDYTLKTGSPAINAGIAVSGVTVDINGVARPNGVMDIGAYEFGSADITPPAAPTGLTVQ